MKKDTKKIIITILIIVSIFTIFFVSRIFLTKTNDKLPEVKLKKISKKENMFALMVETEDNKYEEYQEEGWPGSDYFYKESKCVDNNGTLVENAISFHEDTKTIELETSQTIYCTIYFNKDTILNVLRKNDPNEVISKKAVGNLYRYQGVEKEDGDETHKLVNNNYICFGTTKVEECKNNIDKYMYRIIGITKEGQMYLLKETFLKEGETTAFKWNTKYLVKDCLGESCEWPNSDIYKRLNGTASNGNPIFVDSSEYEYMAKNSNWYNLIEDHDWMYGDTNETKYSGDEMYAIETGNAATKRYWPDEKTQTTCSSSSPCTLKDYTWSKSTNAKIGLLYMHDILYAYPGGNPESGENVKNSWIYYQKDGYNTSQNAERLIDRYGVFNDSIPDINARAVSQGGFFGFWSMQAARGVRPTFYISSKTKIMSGVGSIDNPYTIALVNEDGNYYCDYEYTGDVQTFQVPEDGEYKIELWGASGGDKDQYKGGNGAYTSGLINLSKNSKLYIYVGGSGSNTDIGGYNGGGNLIPGQRHYGSSGGGATDIRLEKNVWNDFNSLKSRIMVAAGGGGANNRNIDNEPYWYGAGNGGAGGGLIGLDGESLDNTHTNPETQLTYGWSYGTGGTQTEGGYQIHSEQQFDPTFSGVKILRGYFGYCNGEVQSGCGNGYYAGSGGNHGAGGGGSSYISGYNGCRAISQDSTENNIIHLDTSEHYSGKVFTNTEMYAGNQLMPNYKGGTMIGNTGNGFARITKIN